jgi:hypothetical protein
VTPQDLISAIVTEQGVLRAPFAPGLHNAVAAAPGPQRLVAVPVESA